jgi:predicted acyltransferase
VLDVRGWRRWAFPLVVLGTNSIAAYCLYEAFMDPISMALVRHLPAGVFRALGPAFEATLVGAGTLALIWLILLWMHRRKIFVRI